MDVVTLATGIGLTVTQISLIVKLVDHSLVQESRHKTGYSQFSVEVYQFLGDCT